MEEPLQQKDIDRIIEFIRESDLDYEYVDNGVFMPFLRTYDSMKIQIHQNEGAYWMSIYDTSKDMPGSVPYQWTRFDTLMQLMEALKHRDEIIYKQYWELIGNSIEVPFEKAGYREDWHEEFTDSEHYTTEEDSLCRYLVFESDEWEPDIMSPWNTVGQDSLGGFLHESKPTRLSKLRFEIHPVGTREGRETYLAKIRCNEDDMFPEHVCYKIISKKGLKKFKESLFAEMDKFRKK